MKLTRALIPAALAAALLVSGCSAGGGKDAAGTDCLAAGDASKQVEVKGKVGEDLELTSKTPISADKLQRSVLKEGEGDVVKEGQTIEVAMTMFNATDGKMVTQQPQGALPYQAGTYTSWAEDGLRCAVSGQQIALVGSSQDILGTQTVDGLTDKDSVIVVMQFGKITTPLKRAEGTAQKAPAGFPEVKLDKDGAPTITIPKDTAAPDKLEVATLIEGKGETVADGDSVTVNYTGVIWRTGEVFDSSWASGSPATFTTDGVIEGFQKALVGQKVGSQVIAIVPAEDGGYGADALVQQGHQADDVMVFVLDILATSHAQ